MDRVPAVRGADLSSPSTKRPRPSSHPLFPVEGTVGRERDLMGPFRPKASPSSRLGSRRGARPDPAGPGPTLLPASTRRRLPAGGRAARRPECRGVPLRARGVERGRRRRIGRSLRAPFEVRRRKISRGCRGQAGPSGGSRGPELRRFFVRRAGGPGGPLRATAGRWRLVVTHRAGSVDQVVAAARRRNLAVSAGILALLAGSVVLIVVSAQRARRLADRQLEFVAGVSHELRTPVAVICSAGENLADGVVEDRDTVDVRPGRPRQDDAWPRMVERVLDLPGRIPAGETTASKMWEVMTSRGAWAPSAQTAREAGFEVERAWARPPPLRADRAAVAQNPGLCGTRSSSERRGDGSGCARRADPRAGERADHGRGPRFGIRLPSSPPLRAVLPRRGSADRGTLGLSLAKHRGRRRGAVEMRASPAAALLHLVLPAAPAVLPAPGPTRTPHTLVGSDPGLRLTLTFAASGGYRVKTAETARGPRPAAVATGSTSRILDVMLRENGFDVLRLRQRGIAPRC